MGYTGTVEWARTQPLEELVSKWYTLRAGFKEGLEQVLQHPQRSQIFQQEVVKVSNIPAGRCKGLKYSSRAL